MKNMIYLFVIISLTMIGVSILFLYYTQSFEEQFSFYDFISYNNLEIETSLKGSEKYLTQAKGDLGELILTNKGYFTQVYEMPRLVGCIDLQDNVNLENSLIRNYVFDIKFFQEGISIYPYERTEIKIG